MLTQELISEAKADVRPYRLSDGRGLYLAISPSSGKWWRFRYRFNGIPNTLSCGVFPEVTLEEARKRREEFLDLIANGINPSQYVKSERAAKRADEARKLAATRFTVDNDGALSFCLGNRRLELTLAETQELRSFLDATRNLVPKVMTCP